jgi:hypothetical protein
MKKIFILSFLIKVCLIFCQLEDIEDETEMFKKTKVLACIAISKARMIRDSVIIKLIFRNLSKILLAILIRCIQ